MNAEISDRQQNSYSAGSAVFQERTEDSFTASAASRNAKHAYCHTTQQRHLCLNRRVKPKLSDVERRLAVN